MSRLSFDGVKILAFVVFGSFLLRLYAIDFGLPGLYDPDELMFELGAIRMLSHATLNPGWFGHPATTTMYGLVLCNVGVFGFGHLVGWFPTLKFFGDAVFANPAWIILPGRVLMALFGAGTVWQTGRLGEALFGRRTGLTAALLMALSPLAVAWAQVIRSDIMGTFFMLISLRAMIRAVDSGRWQDDAKAGIWLGIAVATKWPMGLAGGAMAGVLLREIAGRHLTWLSAAGRISVFGVSSLIALVVTSPYLVLAFPTVVHNLQGEAQLHHLGATGGSVLFNAWWYVRGPLLSGLGPLGFVLAFVGFIRMGLLSRAGVLLGAPILCLAVVFFNQHLVWDRWMLPLLPLFALAAGYAADQLTAWASRVLHISPALVQGALWALLALPLVIADRGQALGRLNDTRQRASAWAKAHIPAGSNVMIEHFAFDLYPEPWHLMFPFAELGCVDARALLKGKVNNGVIDTVRGGRANVDYGTMPRNKADTCRTDFAILTQYDRYKEEQADFPVEYQAYQQLIARGRVVANFAPAQGESYGPVVKVIDFRKGPLRLPPKDER